MATYTSNYNLSKPENTDTNASFISDYRGNMDIIDKQMGNKNIAEEYDNTQTYAVDDYVIYDGDLYKCTTAVTSAEDFDPTKWTQTVASDEFGSGGGGSSTLAGLTDVDLSSPSNGQVLKYNSTSQKWENANESGGGGGGGSFTKDVLYQNTGSSAPSTINLSHAIDDYDAIYFTGYRSQYTSYWASALYLSDDCVTGRNIGLTDDAMYGWYTVTNSTTLTLIGSVNMVVDKVYGVKFGGGGGTGSFVEITSSAYSQLTQEEKMDETKLYLINDTQSGTQDTPIDATTFVNKKENSMSVSASATSLIWTWNGGSLIGASSFQPNAIPSTATKLKFKITTGSSYSTSTERFKLCIGVKATYQQTSWVTPEDTDWLVSKIYNTQNTVIEDYLDLSNVATDCYLMIACHGWTATFTEVLVEKPSAPTGNTEIRYKDVAYGNGSGGSGSVQVQSTVIFEATGASVVNTPYTLLHSIDDYDFVSIYNGIWSEYTTGDKFAEDAFIPVHTFNSLYSDGKQYAITSYSTRYMHISLHESTLTVHARSNLDVCKIVGHKIVGGGSSGGSSAVNYSTTEQEIGTWIDGKPLYSRVFTNVAIPVNSYSSSIDVGCETGTIVKVNPISEHTVGNQILFNNCIYAKIVKTSGQNTMIYPTTSITGAGTSDASLEIQYTKSS